MTSLLDNLAIELPSWAFGNSGTRFKVFGTPGTPRTIEEKLADAATVHRLTGLAPAVALHIPWDTVDDYAALARYADDLGVRLGTVNSNTFQDDDYKLGSVTHSDPRIRQKAIDHHLECIDVMDETGSRDLKIWLADGTNYPGQDDMRGRQDRLTDSLEKIYARLGEDQRLVLEYKFFEPAFYHTDVPDWGTSYAQVAAAVGSPRAVRAVGTACAHNPLPVVIPCHRVVRTDGSLSGYRWGPARKAALLAERYDVDLLSYDPGDELPDDVDLLVGGGGHQDGDTTPQDLVLTLQHVVVVRGGASSQVRYDGMARDRAARPADDLLSDLVAAREGDQRLSEDEVVASAVLLLNAGHEASVNVFGNGLVALLRSPAADDVRRAAASGDVATPSGPDAPPIACHLSKMAPPRSMSIALRAPGGAVKDAAISRNSPMAA